MASYAADHASALADIRDAGAAVTFTRATTAYDEATGLATPTVTTVAGFAMRVPGDPVRYAAGGWSLATMPSLLFAASTFGALPVAGDTVEWGSVVFTVKSVEPLDLNAAGAILSTVVVGV